MNDKYTSRSKTIDLKNLLHELNKSNGQCKRSTIFCVLSLVSLLGFSTMTHSTEIVWQTFTRQSGNFYNDVATDADNLYIAGNSGGTSSTGRAIAFLRKYDGNGVEVWEREIDVSGENSISNSVVTDTSNVYVAGWTQGTLANQVSAGGTDAFVRKFDPDGTEIWTKQFGTPDADMANAIAAHTTGVYVVGTYNFVGPNTVTFLRKYDLDGNEIWTRQISTEGIYTIANSITIDSSGLYIAGYTDGTLANQTNVGSDDAFVQKYDFNGNVLWTRQIGTSSPDYVWGLTNDSTGIYAVGNTNGFVTSGGLVSEQPGSAYIVKFDESGQTLWVRQYGATGSDDAKAVKASQQGIYVTGRTYGNFPGQVSSGAEDAYIRSYDRDGNVQWTYQFGTSDDDRPNSIAINSFGRIYTGIDLRGFAPNYGYVAQISPFPHGNLIGDKDDFQPGNQVDIAPKSSRAQSILNYITSDPGQNPPANLDEGGTAWFTDTNRPVGLTHFFTLPPGARVSGATIHLRAKGAAEVWNDAIIYDQSFSPSESDPACFIIPATCNRQAYSPMIVLRDLLGHEPRESEIMELNIDLSKVPVRTQTQSVPGGHWSAKPDQYRNLLNMLYSGQFNMVLADDSALDYSELSITYAPAGALDGELNGDGLINRDDLNIIMTALNTSSYGQLDPRDLNHDGRITVLDARMLVLKCNNPNCAK